jgi:hypothetical protein
MKRGVPCFMACRLALVTASGAFAQYVNPCDDDIARLCANVQPGGGRMAECLKQNEERLSPECRQQHLTEVGEALRQTQEACGDDMVKFCGSSLQKPGYQLLDCLKLNSTGLSPECKNKLLKALEHMHY